MWISKYWTHHFGDNGHQDCGEKSEMNFLFSGIRVTRQGGGRGLSQSHWFEGWEVGAGLTRVEKREWGG